MLTIAAVVLAAGLSRRMGRPKMVLPWGETTVIGQVVTVLATAGVADILVVVGGARQRVESALSGLPARLVYNPRYSEDQMAFSLQAGLSSLAGNVDAALVALGDQPQIQTHVVQAIVDAYRETRASLVIPSYRMRRGHPWMIARPLWEQVLALRPPETLREVLNAHADQIHYLTVDNDSVLRDLDTPSDYDRERPKA
jgi:molybdenum cofactor cytidylyltransferase